MPRKRFLTPADIPAEEICRGLVLPNSQDWLGLFSEALSQTIYPYNYEQINDSDLTPDEAAAEAYVRYTAWLDATCETSGECPAPVLPDTTYPMIRRNPSTKQLEQLGAEDWEALDESLVPPEPDAREEETEDAQKCGAASNAVNALKQLYSAVLSVYDSEIDPLLNQAELAYQVALAYGSMFGPISASFVAYSEIAWEGFTYLLNEVTMNDWTDEFTDILVCLFKENETVTNGTVTFDFQEIIWGLVGFLLPVVDTHLRVRWQVWYLLQCIGTEGLNLSGGTTAVDGDCVTCDTWCYESDDWSAWERMRGGSVQTDGLRATNGNAAYGAPHGTYPTYWEYKLVVDTTQCVINQFEVSISSNALNTACWTMLSIEPPESFSTKYYVKTNNALVTFFGREQYVVESTSDVTTLYAAMTDSNTLTARGKKWRVRGTGVNPFAVGSNC